MYHFNPALTQDVTRKEDKFKEKKVFKPVTVSNGMARANRVIGLDCAQDLNEQMIFDGLMYKNWNAFIRSYTALTSISPEQTVPIQLEPVGITIDKHVIRFNLPDHCSFVESIVIYNKTFKITYKLDHLPFGTLGSYISRIQNPTVEKIEKAIKEHQRFNEEYGYMSKYDQSLKTKLNEVIAKQDKGKIDLRALLSILTKKQTCFSLDAFNKPMTSECEGKNLEINMSLDHIAQQYMESFEKTESMYIYLTIVYGQWRGATTLLKVLSTDDNISVVPADD